ncbi:hypothetical protein EDD90_3249 [Streptomyces sp. Ag109_O5-1]|uniref:hypothetical protein n=1 Tax=Streptomyces sp. Ag109_O5-1 TaxID=1938851 RepID=UPI000F4D60CF|nr:hypothetical protein [Streptomyces sp. Ag109_O5-1]RPE40213.1 hypothetical protein EDD90_3249 [Streptomyces sp. Ag109_O5-1]
MITPPRWGCAEWRRENLLAAISEQGGEWTVGRVKQIYRRWLRRHIYRHTIRLDLARLHRDGHLDRHGDGTPRRFYTLRQEGATS